MSQFLAIFIKCLEIKLLIVDSSLTKTESVLNTLLFKSLGLVRFLIYIFKKSLMLSMAAFIDQNIVKMVIMWIIIAL